MKEYKKISGFSDEISEEIEKQFSVLKKLGISYFEVRGVEGKNISALTDEELQVLKRKMKKYDIKVSSIGSPIGKIKLEEPFESHFEQYKRIVEIAQVLEAPYIRMFSFYHNAEEWTSQERREVLERLKTMIDYAKRHNVILLHENEKDVYGDSIQRCLDLMSELSCEHFKAVFDPANFVQCGKNTIDAYEQLKPYIVYVHIKDACKQDGKVVPAGKGDGNIEYILNDLFANGYDGFLSLEPHLGNFKGLQDLELDNKMEELEDGGEGTFTLAYESFMDILKRV